MKKTIRNILFVTTLSPFIIQCASQDEVQRLQYQLHVVNKKLEEMKSTTVGDIQKRQAASSNMIDQLDREIIKLKNQLEETNHLNRRLKEQNKELETNLNVVTREESEKRRIALEKIEAEQREKEARIAELTEKLRLQQESLQAIQDARVRDAERRARDAKLKAQQAREKALAASNSVSNSNKGIIRISADQNKNIVDEQVNPEHSSMPEKIESDTNKSTAPVAETPTVSTSSSSAAVAATNSSSSKFDKAEQLYSERNYNQAYATFEDIASANPASDEGISAGFMMGECLFAQKEYDKAILQYQKIISQNGNHPKAASATLKQAMAFELLADNETARMIYKKILNHYGSSPEAKTAKEKLGNL